MMLQKLKWAGLVLVLAVAPITGAEDTAEAKPVQVVFVQKGEASWYGPGFHGRRTASGDRFNQNALTAAHRKLPLGTRATVVNLTNGKSVEVEINDRGPYARGRILDLSKAAAHQLGMKTAGTALVRVMVTADQAVSSDRSI